MRTFKINSKFSIICTSEGTRYGFRHLATLTVNGYGRDKAKACYYNRTWERFEFESVISSLLHSSKETTGLTDRKIKNWLAKQH